MNTLAHHSFQLRLTPDYSWTVGITQPPGPGSSYLRKIEVTVIHDYYPKRPYKVILYRPITLQL